MISRQWKGIVKEQSHDEYVSFLKNVVLKDASTLSGYCGASIYERELDGAYEFMVATNWVDLASIKAFAGEDINKAMVPEEAQHMMISYDKTALHYDVLR